MSSASSAMKELLSLLAIGLALSVGTGLEKKQECTKDNKKCHPEQIHLSYGRKPNDIVVTWSTLQDTMESTVRFSVKNDNSKQQEVAGTRKLFVDGGSKKLKQTIHRAVMQNLNFNTTYQYTVGSKYGMSHRFTFKTVPEGDKWEVRAVLFGDLGVYNGIALPFIKDDVSKRQYDAVFHIGDMAYNLCDDQGNRGNQFMNDVQPIAATVPYMVCPGNHEHAYNFSHYRNRFTMPNYEKYESLFYSFNLGPIHFVSVNTEVYIEYFVGPVKRQDLRTHYEWIENDLKEANLPENRQKHPWIVMYGHRPMLCSNSLPADGCKNDYPQRIGIPSKGGYGMEVLLKKYGVDVAIWAHEHSYERMWPVYNKTVYNGSLEHPYTNPRAPVHFTSGSAGCVEYTDHFFPKDKLSGWSAFRNSDYGYTRLHAYNATHLHFEQLSVKKVSARLQATGQLKEPEVIDQFWVIKDSHKPYDHL